MRYAKAAVGALIAGLGVLGTALTDNAITPAEGIGAAVAALIALGAVWSVPNREPASGAAREDLRHQLTDRGDPLT